MKRRYRCFECEKLFVEDDCFEVVTHDCMYYYCEGCINWDLKKTLTD